MAPMSLKRTTPSHSDDGSTDEPDTKRRRFEEFLPSTPPPEEELNMAPSKAPMFDEDPHRLLLRSVALTLEHVGFTAASPESLEALCAEAETCQF
jgi:transcription initiation factor TFIID subunit 8